MRQLFPAYPRQNILLPMDSRITCFPTLCLSLTFTSSTLMNINICILVHIQLKRMGPSLPHQNITFILPPLKETCFFTGISCNGLLHFQNEQYDDFLWNPTTNEFKALPNSSSCDHQQPRGLRVTNYKIGCGMWSDNRCADNYKMLHLVLADTEKVEEEEEEENSISIDLSYHIHLYSLKTNSWKIIPCSEFSLLSGPGVTINGVYYTLGYLIGNVEIGVLLSFDFSTETLSSIPRPPIQKGLSSSSLTVPPIQKLSSCAHFLEYKGLFGYLACWEAENKIPVRFELWVMKNGSWTMESVFNTCGVSRPLRFSRNGELLYFLSVNNEVLVFDRATGKLNHPDINFCWSIAQLTPFVESFVQLNGISHAEAEDLEKEEEGYIIEATEGPLMQV
ncbi:uncharacterized protein LOC131004977 [Salvia miltiorrhiza]|uniref:uncharacterized protein LOC131004977 n=1 Tax=Salvia miltiorrhiza TaxID=226208 RepID=UPI0025AD737D|nr:uncharacterized protein LOC131004977 [Salvia miltiorrhiza]XP_057787739.1 uncharacterized protein LOC131004977 [Salvia miltiorrhiza]XP_057787740.1 uncharacterized protein LOC131004977 [Salvia miltiorrhiza]